MPIPHDSQTVNLYYRSDDQTAHLLIEELGEKVCTNEVVEGSPLLSRCTLSKTEATMEAVRTLTAYLNVQLLETDYTWLIPVFITNRKWIDFDRIITIHFERSPNVLHLLPDPELLTVSAKRRKVWPVSQWAPQPLAEGEEKKDR